MFSFLQNSLMVSNVKLLPASEIIFVVAKTLQMSSLLHVPGHLLIGSLSVYSWELTVLIYNRQKIFIINHE